MKNWFSVMRPLFTLVEKWTSRMFEFGVLRTPTSHWSKLGILQKWMFLCNFQETCSWPLLFWWECDWWQLSAYAAGLAYGSTHCKWSWGLHFPARRCSTPQKTFSTSLLEWESARKMDWTCTKWWQCLAKMAPVITWLDPLWSFLCGYVKGLVYVPPLPTNVVELKQRISLT